MVKKGMVTQKMKKPAKKSPRIFTLPPELRNRIWELAVTVTATYSEQQPYPRTPGLVRTCRQARREALGIWIIESTFQTVIQDFDLAWMHETYYPSTFEVGRSAWELGVLPNKVVERQTISHFGAPNWKNLVKSLKAYHESLRALIPFDEGGSTAESKVVVAAYGMVESMRAKEWNEVERRLEQWHGALAAMDASWT
ncbi:hypothetical protein LTR17_016779 [Elasticomyces elasticus]|nr:hypothetical protein LTR17_016779 [Elasticomyces elasticus]